MYGLIIDPLSRMTIDTSGGEFDALSGWALVESTYKIGVVAALYVRNAPYGIVTSATVPVSPLPTDFSFPGQTYSELRHDPSTVIALLNPSLTETATVNFKVHYKSLEFPERTITLTPLSKISQFLDKGGLFADSAYILSKVEMKSSPPLAAACSAKLVDSKVLTEHFSRISPCVLW